MDLICERIKTDIEFARKIIKFSSDSPQIFINKAISSHSEIAIENSKKLKKHTLNLALRHQDFALNFFKELKTKKNPEPELLAQCATHLVIASELTHHKDVKVRATCSNHKDLFDFYVNDTAPPVLASIAKHNLNIAYELFKHKSNLVRRSCSKHTAIAKKLVHKEIDSFVIPEIAKHYEVVKAEFKKTNCLVFLAQSALFEDVALDLYSSPSVLVRSNSATHLNVAQYLVNDDSWLVRKECAKHSTLQDRFINDKEPYVRSICAATKEHGHLFKNDNDALVCNQIALNPYYAHLMVNHRNKDVANKAKFTMKVW